MFGEFWGGLGGGFGWYFGVSGRFFETFLGGAWKEKN